MAILPDLKLEGAVAVADRLRQLVMAVTVGQLPSISCSFGVVEYTTNKTSDSLLRCVDGLLYQAKESDRSCINIG